MSTDGATGGTEKVGSKDLLYYNNNLKVDLDMAAEKNCTPPPDYDNVSMGEWIYVPYHYITIEQLSFNCLYCTAYFLSKLYTPYITYTFILDFVFSHW